MEEINKESKEIKIEEIKKDKDSKNIGLAFLAYILFIIPMLTGEKDDPFVKFHTKQGLILFLAWVFNIVFGMIPVVGWMLSPLIAIFLVIVWIVGVVNVLQGKESELPLIGQFSDKFKF